MENARKFTVSQVVFGTLLVLIAAVVIFYGLRLFFQFGVWSLADSLARELAVYIPLNHGFLKAATWILFVGLIPLSALGMSLSRWNWKVGLMTGGVAAATFYAVIGFASTGFKIDPISGVAAKCYSLFNGKVRYFDLVSGLERQFDPETGRPCVPVTPETAVKLSQYEHSIIPKRIADDAEPDMFDRALGTPLVWYYKAGDGFIELFDNEGFHPDTSISLLPITAEAANIWRSQRAIRLSDAKRADEERARIERERREQEERAERERLEAERLAAIDQQRQEELRQAAGNDCDRLAGNGFDRNRNLQFPGVPFQLLAVNASDAAAACKAAADLHPDIARYRYQSARALQTVGSIEAKPLLRKLIQDNYPAAFDNMGWLMVREGQVRQALDVFRHGADLGSAEAMVSLAGFLAEGKWTDKNQREAVRLLEAAAEQGHPAAREAIAKYEEQRKIGQIGGALLGVIVGEIIKKRLN